MRVRAILGMLAAASSAAGAAPDAVSEADAWRLVGLAAVVVCVARRRRAIGGWLLYFVIQVFAGLIRSTLSLVATVAQYHPARQRSLALMSTVPDALMWLAVAAICVMLLKTRDWRWVISLRAAISLKIVVGFISAAIDSRCFPDNVTLDVAMLILLAIFLVYLFFSRRVHHVFTTKDWEALHHRGVPGYMDRVTRAGVVYTPSELEAMREQGAEPKG